MHGPNAMMEAAIRAAREEAKEQGLVEKGSDLKVVVNAAYRDRGGVWLAFGSKAPSRPPSILKESVERTREELDG